MDEDVAPAVPIEHEPGGPAYVIRIAQVDDDISGAVKDDHGVVGCEARDDRETWQWAINAVASSS